MTGVSKLRIGIQGIKASFHDVAAQKYFGKSQEIIPVECPTFRALCESLKKKEADFCIMAIENSIAGSILPNYSLLEQFQFKIVGEIYLRIELNLMALKGQDIENLKSVQSHPMAIFQCEDFLNSHPYLKILEANDTAESARDISSSNSVGLAAIASSMAAKTYGLEILKENIESNKHNYTRFLIVSREDDYRELEGANKTSLRFQTAHKPGSLASVLNLFKEYDLNLTKIQSVPISGSPLEYSIHVDLEWKETESFNSTLKLLKTKSSNLIHFGNYVKAERPSSK